MPLKRLCLVILLSVGMLWAVSLISRTAQALPSLRPPVAPPWNTSVRVNDNAAVAPVIRGAPAFAAKDSLEMVYAVWQDERNGDLDIYSAQSADAGRTWSYITRINHDILGHAQTDPDVAVAASGMLHAVWEDTRLSGSSIYYARSLNGGRTWSTEIKINDTTRRSLEPAIAVYADTVCVTWYDYTTVSLDCSLNGGDTWGTDQSPADVNGITPDVAVDQAGTAHVVWADERDPNYDIYYARLTGGTWSVELKLNTDTGGASQQSPAIALNGNALVVGWKDARSGEHIFARYATDGGTKWAASDVQVSDVGNVIGAPAFTAGRNALWATWIVLSNTEYIAFADTGSQTWGRDVPISMTTQAQQGVAAAGSANQVWVGWAQNDNIWASARAATAWSSPEQVNNSGEAAQRYPALGAGDTGELFAVWQDTRVTDVGLYTARSADDGLTWGTNNFIPDSAGASEPTLAVSGTDNLHVVWGANHNSYWQLFYNRSEDGGTTWIPPTLLAEYVIEQRAKTGAGLEAQEPAMDESPAVAVVNNSVYVAWAWSGDLFLAKSNTGGSTWNVPTAVFTEVNGLAVHAAGRVTLQAVDYAGEAIVLAWTNDDARTCLAGSPDGGSTWPERICFDNGGATRAESPALAYNGWEAVAFWSDNRAGGRHLYRAVWIPSTGNLVRSPLQVDDASGPATLPSAFFAWESPNEVLHVVWQDGRNGNDDVYWARSNNGGLDWQPSSRVYDDSAGWPQQRPVLAHNGVYSASKVWAAWQDFRRVNWDIYATTIAGGCGVPLTGLGITGPTSVFSGEQVVLSSILTPSNTTLPIGYEWRNPPNPMQSTDTATYTWDLYGNKIVTLTTSSCAGALSRVHTVKVKCTVPITDVSFTVPNWVTAGEPFTLTGIITPAMPDLPVTIHWNPEPEAGQGTLQPRFRLAALGEPIDYKLLTLQAENCGGSWGGSVSTQHWLQLRDTTGPVVSDAPLQNWITQTVGGFTVPFSLTAQDLGSGLIVTSAVARYSNDGGVSYSAAQPVSVTGDYGTLEPQLIFGQHDFGHESGSGAYSLNRMQVLISDTGRNVGGIIAYVKVDLSAPSNPASMNIYNLSGDVRLTNTWHTSPTVEAAWGVGNDGEYGSGVKEYLYTWSQSPTTLPEPGAAGVYATSSRLILTQIPSDGQNWYFHLRARDNAGWLAPTALHRGPYWLDSNRPTAVTVHSTVPPTLTWTNSPTFTVRWYPAMDTGSGIAGYAYSWNDTQYSTPIPFPKPSLISGSLIYTTGMPYQLDGGNYWFHIMACDNASYPGFPSNCSALISHIGPFRLDRQAPPMQGAMPDQLPGSWSPDNTINLSWSHTDPGLTSPEDRYSYVWDTVSNTVPPGTANFFGTGANINLPTTLGDGDQQWFHLRAGDQAGNWSNNTYHLGPFRIDTLPPAAPVLSSTWPITGEWTNNNDVRVTWRQPVDGNGSGVFEYAYLWDHSPTTVPAPSVNLSDPSNTVTTIGENLPTAFNHYFHVRARDRVGHWGPTLHVGPFMIDVTPAVLFASPGSGGPGSEVLLTGLAFQPSVTVTLWFTKPGGISPYDPYDEFLSSPQGTFQVLANIPVDAAEGQHGFKALTSSKEASVPFSVTPGLSITIQPNPIYRGHYYTVTVRNIQPSSGGLVLESDLLAAPKAVPATGNRIKNVKLYAPHSAYSGTHVITVSNRVDNIAVQRGTTALHVLKVLPVPPPPPPTITLSFDHGIRDRWIQVSGYSGFGLGESCVYEPAYAGTPAQLGVDKGDGCVKIDQQLEWRAVAGGSLPACSTTANGNTYYGLPQTLWNQDRNLTITAQGELHGEIRTYDGWYNATNSNLPVWDVSCEMPLGAYQLCLVGYETSPGLEFDQVDEEVLVCHPFTLDPPPQFTSAYKVVDSATDQPLPKTFAPQLSFSGFTIGPQGGEHPKPVHQTFSAINTVYHQMNVSLPEGGYTFSAVACRYAPRQLLKTPGRTDYQVHTIELTRVNEAGPAIVDVTPGIQSYLQTSGQGKIGPFMSLQGIAVPGRPALQTTFTLTFDSLIEDIQSVQVTVTNSSGFQVTGNAVPTSDPNYWTYSLALSDLPPGEVKLQLQAYGKYLVADDVGAECGGEEPQPGPVYELPIVMAAPPPWLASTWSASQHIDYFPTLGKYVLTGQLNKGFIGLPFSGTPPELPFLGTIENMIDAGVLVTETFIIPQGSWEAKASFLSELAVMCLTNFSGGDCHQVNSMTLTASPADHGAITGANQQAFPNTYSTQPINLFSKEFGPWPVYSGIIASYWGVVNVHLSIDFGILAYADVIPSFGQDLGPQVTLTPGANLNGTISLWVDILLGLASAGVDGMPSLCLNWPMMLKADLSDPIDIASTPNIGFKLSGRVWAEVAWWSKSFGPFDIFSYGNCGPGAHIYTLASDAPPSVLAAPAVTADGYGHTLASWVHNISNDPAHVVGVLYSAYSDGANWATPTAVAGEQEFLVTDPAIAFAGYDEAVAVYTSNDPAASNPITWTDVVTNTYTQKISYSRWNGQSWTNPMTVASNDNASTALGRGRVALAGDPSRGRALAVWLKQNMVAGMKRWQMEFSAYDAATNTWTTPSLVASAPSGSLDAEVSLAFDSQGLATAVWVRQAGVEAGNTLTSPFTKNDQRRLVVATWDPATPLTWTVSVNPIGLPVGALMPSIGFDEYDRPVLAYALYGKDRDNVTPTGLGNANQLGYAVGSTTNEQVKRLGAQALSWEARVADNIRGVEQPRVVALPQQQAAIVYRGFGAPGTPEYAGVAMAAVLDLQTLELVLSDPAPITGGNGWLFSATTTRKPGALAGNIRSSLMTVGAYNLGGPAVSARLSGAQVDQIGLTDDQVYATQVTIMPDLAIAAADFAVSETLPLSGTLVPFSFTVRNQGLARNAEPVMVELIQDLNTPHEKVIFTGTIPAQLMFNGKYTFGGQWSALAGVHHLTARVHPPIAADLDSTNNETTIVLGVPATPGNLTASLNAPDHSLGLSWQSSQGPAFAHYRLYRATGSGQWTWLTDTFDAWYIDRTLGSGGLYRYAVSGVSTAGIESPLSAEVSVTTSQAVYLPLVRR
ncbi:hypothetical protein PLCT2_02820 [Planctomycetaceae bacterium]|nr:hypothetical protein PLCT2_02820 [Planctomycetaceae bacterium]